MKKKQIILIILIIVSLSLITISLLLFFKKENKETPVKNIEVLDRISGYEYRLEDRDTEIYKETFLNLKEILEKEDKYNEEEYAKLLTKLFLIDLYTLENKINKYDVGALDFIYESEQEKFKNKVLNTIYKLLEDNSGNTRKQSLPVVNDVTIANCKATTYKQGTETKEAFEISATISYKEDLGYDKEVKVILTKEENKLYIVHLSANN